MTVDYMSQVSAISILIERLDSFIAIGYDFSLYKEELDKIYDLTNQMLDIAYPKDDGIEPSPLKISAFFCYNLVENCPIAISMIPGDSVFNSDFYKMDGQLNFELITKQMVSYIGFLVICDICSMANSKYGFNRHLVGTIDSLHSIFDKLVIYTNPGFQRDFIELLKVGALRPQAIVMCFTGLMEGLHGSRKEHVLTGW